MFASNQRFSVSGDAGMLPAVLDMAVELSDGRAIYVRDNEPVRLAWRLSPDGRYFCVGSGGMGQEAADEGWTDFEGPYDPEKFAQEILKWLKARTYPRSDCDGIVEEGFLCESVSSSRIMTDPEFGYDDFSQCIACFSPYNQEFEK